MAGWASNFMRVFSKRWKRITVLGLLVCAGIYVALKWPSRPERILIAARFQERKGPEGTANGQRMRAELIACGPEAIAPCIQELRHFSPRYRGHAAFLPSTLGGLGTKAQAELRAAIDYEHDEHARAYLIFGLQHGFGDFSRFDHWLTNATNSQKWDPIIWMATTRITMNFQAHTSAPWLATDSGINPEFLQWWSTNRLNLTSDGKVHSSQRQSLSDR